MWEVWGQWVCRFVFVVCGYRFANDFFCKIVSRGSLIDRWCYWKMFAVNFKQFGLTVGETQLGKSF